MFCFRVWLALVGISPWEGAFKIDRFSLTWISWRSFTMPLYPLVKRIYGVGRGRTMMDTRIEPIIGYLPKKGHKLAPNPPCKRIWNSISFRVVYSAWRVYFKRIQTIKNLNTKGMDIHNGCSLCRDDEQSMDQLLVSSPLGKRHWEYCYHRLRGCENIRLMLEQLWLKTWWVVPFLRRLNGYMVMWALWKERNGKFFKDKTKKFHNLISDIQEFMYGLSRGNTLFRGLNLNDFTVEWEDLVAWPIFNYGVIAIGVSFNN